MDLIINIFKSLGADQSFFIQFGMVVVLYLLLTNLFFGKLQFVIETRENKTTKREGDANKLFAQAEALAESYKKSLDETHSQAIQISTKRKSDILERNKNAFKKKAKEVEAIVDSERVKARAELDSRRDVIMSNAESLSKDLLDKLSK